MLCKDFQRVFQLSEILVANIVCFVRIETNLIGLKKFSNHLLKEVQLVSVHALERGYNYLH